MEANKILNVWRSKPNKLVWYEYSPNRIVYKNGDFAIYSEYTDSHLYTYKNIAINCLVGLNKSHLDRLANNTTPKDDDKSYYLYLRALETKQKGIELLTIK